MVIESVKSDDFSDYFEHSRFSQVSIDKFKLSVKKLRKYEASFQYKDYIKKQYRKDAKRLQTSNSHSENIART